MGLLQSAFPPAAWWALIAAAWFLMLSVTRKRLGAPRGIPRVPFAMVLVFVFTILTMAVTGHVLFLFLLAWCALTVALEFLVPRKADARPDRRFVLWVTGLAGLSLVVTAGLTFYRMSNMTPVELVQRAGGPGVEIEVARVARRTVNPEQDFKAILESTDNGRVAKAVAKHLDCNESDTDCMLILVDAVESMDDDGYPTADARTKLRTLSGLDLPSDATAQDWRDALAARDSPAEIR